MPRLPHPWRTTLLAGFSLIALGGVVSGSQQSHAATEASPAAEASSPSSAQQMSLVEYLRLKGAVFYGAWWCPHCTEQKKLFGSEAALRLPYVECDKDDQGRKRCELAKVRAFPTWDLGGQRREGVLSLEELEVWSGFNKASSTPQATPQ